MVYRLIEKWISVPNPQSRYQAVVWCPDCGLRIGIIGHRIDQTGKLSPSLVCPHEKCGFHEYVQLKNYPDSPISATD